MGRFHRAGKGLNAMQIHCAKIPSHDARASAAHYIGWLAYPDSPLRRNRYIRSVYGLLYLSVPAKQRPQHDKRLKYPDETACLDAVNNGLEMAMRERWRLYGIHAALCAGDNLRQAVDWMLAHGAATAATDVLPITDLEPRNYEHRHWRKQLPALPMAYGFVHAFVIRHRFPPNSTDARIAVLRGSWAPEAVTIAQDNWRSLVPKTPPKHFIVPRFVDDFVVKKPAA
jgi:hypothetical protein